MRHIPNGLGDKSALKESLTSKTNSLSFTEILKASVKAALADFCHREAERHKIKGATWLDRARRLSPVVFFALTAAVTLPTDEAVARVSHMERAQ